MQRVDEVVGTLEIDGIGVGRTDGDDGALRGELLERVQKLPRRGNVLDDILGNDAVVTLLEHRRIAELRRVSVVPGGLGKAARPQVLDELAGAAAVIENARFAAK